MIVSVIEERENAIGDATGGCISVPLKVSDFLNALLDRRSHEAEGLNTGRGARCKLCSISERGHNANTLDWFCSRCNVSLWQNILTTSRVPELEEVHRLPLLISVDMSYSWVGI